MGRNRAPQPPSSKYITPEGHAALTRELDDLWRVQRPAVTKSVAEAAAQGDRSENAEYIYGKRQLAQIDRRIRFLRKRLDDIHIVDRAPGDTNKVYFGARFTLADERGTTAEYRLVGPDETSFGSNYISMDAPLGRAVLGKPAGAEITVRTPDGERTYTLETVHYPSSSSSTT
jgi:transcription elongation factor GreB